MENFNTYLLIEQMLMSEITIGFEFECFYPKSSEKIIEEIVKKYDIDWADDDIIIPNENYKTAEFRTKPVHLNNIGIMTTYQIFKEFYVAGCRTNKSCGLHTHFAISPELKKTFVDNFWFIYNFFDKGIYNRFSVFDGCSMFHENEIDSKNDKFITTPAQASITQQKNYIKNIKNILNGITNKEEKFKFLNNTIKDLKTKKARWFLVRLHEQGTIEWRGPRHLFDYYDEQYSNIKIDNLITLKRYLLFIIRFAKEIIKILHNPYPIGGISKKEYEYYLYTERPKPHLDDKIKAQLYQAIISYVKNNNIINIILNAVEDEKKLEMFNNFLQEPIIPYILPYMKTVGIGNTKIEIATFPKSITFINWYIHDTLVDFHKFSLNNIYFKDCVFDKCTIIPTTASFNVIDCDFSSCTIKIPSFEMSAIFDKIRKYNKVHSNTEITAY